MHDLETLRSGGYKDAGLTRLKLTSPLKSFPPEILGLGETLEQLDLSGTGLSSFPSNIGKSLPNLRIAFFSQCAFTTFPRELASCPKLEMVAFRGNGMSSIPEDALPSKLRWLILTDNTLTALPRSIGKCERLEKCMLAGNQLKALPEEMQNCKRLGLLRISSNDLASLPDWLFGLPELAFLSFAGNPCSTHLADMDTETNETADADRGTKPELARVHWNDLEVQHTLGEGASGIIYKGLWRISPHTTEEVAIKLFKGSLTSDGAPEDEMTACIAAGRHDDIIDVLGRIHHHPDEKKGTFKGGLVMQLIPPYYRTLGQPPSLQTCTRDTYPADAELSFENTLNILAGIATAARHLHTRGIAHGDLYAHNILTNEEGHAILGDFGAATVHGRGISPLLEKVEVLAFAHLIEDLLGLVSTATDEESLMVQRLNSLHRRCSVKSVPARPTFDEVIIEMGDIRSGKTSIKLLN